MKTRNIQTVVDSDLVSVVSEIQGCSELQVRCLSYNSRTVRYIVVDSAEVKQESFSVRILAEGQFNHQRQKFSFSAPDLTISMADIVKDAMLSYQTSQNNRFCLMA